jgi:UPF0271 protein
MRAVLDASAFFCENAIEGELFTTPAVVDELVDIRARGNFEKLSAAGLRVVSPEPQDIVQVEEAAITSRDRGVISATDTGLLALALGMDAILFTDDFAIQNVASVLGVKTSPIQQRRARRIHWKYRCSGCGRYYDHDGECRICGAAIKRKLK